MSTFTTVLAMLAALEHLYIMFLETIATSSESTSRVFGISIDQLKSKTISTLLKNQGVYNGLIAVLLLVAVWQQDLLCRVTLSCTTVRISASSTARTRGATLVWARLTVCRKVSFLRSSKLAKATSPSRCR